mmetsp:Transcript_118473/g.342554  ORF Transcript_118473/g.342554 Transcript_118473/m.342554 type:complete len:553 (-) Transcript_118473:67-1725(-)
MMFAERVPSDAVTPERSVTPPPRRPTRAAVAHSPRSSNEKEDVLTNSPVSRQREPIKIRGEDKFASPQLLGKENLRPPATWGVGLATTPPTPVKTPSRLPTVQEQAPTVEDVDYMPRWVQSSISDASPAYDISDISFRRRHSLADECEEEEAEGARLAMSAAEKSGFETGPKVRNTFLHFESPLKKYDPYTLSPPKTVPPSFAPMEQICGQLSDRLPPALPMPQRRDENSPCTMRSMSGWCGDRTASPPSCKSRPPQASIFANVRPVRLADYLPDMEPVAALQPSSGSDSHPAMQAMDWGAPNMQWMAQDGSAAMLGGMGCGPTAEVSAMSSFDCMQSASAPCLGVPATSGFAPMPTQMVQAQMQGTSVHMQTMSLQAHSGAQCGASAQPVPMFGAAPDVGYGDRYYGTTGMGYGWADQSMDVGTVGNSAGGLCGDQARPLPSLGPRVSICAGHFPEPSAAALAAAHQRSGPSAIGAQADVQPSGGASGAAPSAISPPSAGSPAPAPAPTPKLEASQDHEASEVDDEESPPAAAEGAPQKRSTRRRRGGRRR